MFPPQGRGIYLGRGVITRPGYVYSRAEYNPVIGYFQPQFNPTARTRFVSPTPPRTRAYYHGYGELYVAVYKDEWSGFRRFICWQFPPSSHRQNLIRVTRNMCKRLWRRILYLVIKNCSFSGFVVRDISACLFVSLHAYC